MVEVVPLANVTVWLLGLIFFFLWFGLEEYHIGNYWLFTHSVTFKCWDIHVKTRSKYWPGLKEIGKEQEMCVYCWMSVCVCVCFSGTVPWPQQLFVSPLDQDPAATWLDLCNTNTQSLKQSGTDGWNLPLNVMQREVRSCERKKKQKFISITFSHRPHVQMGEMLLWKVPQQKPWQHTLTTRWHIIQHIWV